MTRAFGCTCNQAERLADALESVRGVLVAEPPVARWGLGYIQSGEVLLSRTPRRSDTPIDFYDTVARIQSHYVIGHAASADDLSGNANTQPFRYRRWLFAQEGELENIGRVQEALLDRVPGFLRRNVRGKTLAEHVFQIFLARLHDSANIEDVNLPLVESRRALRAAVAEVREILAKEGIAHSLGNLLVTNGRSMVAARLAGPLYMRNLNVPDAQGSRSKSDQDHPFRGILAISGAEHPEQGFEEIPAGSVLMVTRDLRIEVTALGD